MKLKISFGILDKYIFYILYVVELFFTNILLFNFMVAILSEKYEIENERGSFSFK